MILGLLLRETKLEVLSIGPFKVQVQRSSFAIARDNAKISFLPGETEKAVDLLVHASTLRGMKVFPEKISHSPFHVIFSPERFLYLERRDKVNEKVGFKFEEVDDLISALKNGINKIRDVNSIQGAPKGGSTTFNARDPIIDGR